MSKSKQKRDYMFFIEDIVTCIEKIERYTGNVSFEEFGRNDMAVDAVIRNLEIIGEAIKKDSGRNKEETCQCRMERSCRL